MFYTQLTQSLLGRFALNRIYYIGIMT